MEKLQVRLKAGDVVKYNGYINTKRIDTVESVCQVTVTRVEGESVFYGIKKGINCMGRPFEHELSFHISRFIEIVKH